MRKGFVVCLAALAAPVSAAPALSPAEIEGIWLNPRGTVAVRTEPCAQNVCGRIVWASSEAQADARDSGVVQLVGTQLLEGYRPKGRGAWAGTVFVPDMGRRFYSEIHTVSLTQMQVKGCILGGLICKSQVWTRIGQVPV